MSAKEIRRPLFLCRTANGEMVLTHFAEDKYVQDECGFVSCEYPVVVSESATVVGPESVANANAPVTFQHHMKFIPISFLEPPRKMGLKVDGFYRVENDRFYNLFKNHLQATESSRSNIALAGGPLKGTH